MKKGLWLLSVLIMVLLSGCTNQIDPRVSTEVATNPQDITQIDQKGGIQKTGNLQDITIAQIQMLSENRGWAIDNKAHVYKTTEQNKWTEVTPTLPNTPNEGLPLKGYFLNANEAWILYSSGEQDKARVQLAHTSNSGTTWEFTSVKDKWAMSIEDVQFLDARTGFLLAGYSGGAAGFLPAALYQTSDGGRTWSLTATAYANDAQNNLPKADSNWIYFKDSRVGWTTGQEIVKRTDARDPSTTGLYRTEDGGQTWVKQDLNLPENELRHIYKPVLRGAQGSLIVTTSQVNKERKATVYGFSTLDEGKTWQQSGIMEVALKTNTDPVDPIIPYLLDDNNTWMISDSGLSISNDGGKNWISVNKDIKANRVTNFGLFDAQKGWMHTTDKGLLLTNNKGITWTK